MKFLKFIPIALCLGAASVQAQNPTEVEQLKKQLQEMKENFERVQRQQREQIDTLSKKLDELTKTSPTAASTPAPTASPTNAVAADKSVDQKKLEEQLAAELGAIGGTGATNAATSSEAPLTESKMDLAAPKTVMRAGSAYMNISFDTIVDAGTSTVPNPSQQIELGDHDPQNRGFSLRNAELAVDGAVDPYFKGFGNIVLKLDQNNETEIELEEAFIQTTSLPHNLQVKAGQFFAAFGRQNPQHPHQWAFVDAPIILERAFGPEGLRSIGTQLSWLAPLPFYTEFSLGILNGQGETSFSFRNPGEPDASGVNTFAGRATTDRVLQGLGDLVYVPRIASSFDIGENQTLLTGISGAFGPNDTGPTTYTEIYGIDLFWKWKAPDAHEGFPFVTWQSEGLFRRFEAGADPSASLPAANLLDYGFYSQVLYGFRPHWVAGFRGEYANGNSVSLDPGDPFRGERYRLSPVVTWYPSEFSKLRLQYNWDQGQLFGTASSVWLQLEFLLGAHGAHKF